MLFTIFIPTPHWCCSWLATNIPQYAHALIDPDNIPTMLYCVLSPPQPWIGTFIWRNVFYGSCNTLQNNIAQSEILSLSLPHEAATCNALKVHPVFWQQRRGSNVFLGSAGVLAWVLCNKAGWLALQNSAAQRLLNGSNWFHWIHWFLNDWIHNLFLTILTFCGHCSCQGNADHLDMYGS